MEGRVTPKIKKIMFNKLLVTAEEVESKIILSKSEDDTARLKEVQTVVLAGPFCEGEGGSGIKAGDKVVLDPVRLKATTVAINKITGEYVPFHTRIEKDLIDIYLLINDRDVTAILE